VLYRNVSEPSSRDPMVESTSSSGNSSDTNEPVCAQLLTQLNTAYQHLAPDAQALVSIINGTWRFILSRFIFQIQNRINMEDNLTQILLKIKNSSVKDSREV